MSHSLLGLFLKYFGRFYPSLSAISTYFKKYRATALGIAVSGSGVGESGNAETSLSV